MNYNLFIKYKSGLIKTLILLAFIFPALKYTDGMAGNSGIGYNGAPFLKISPAARQVAMGEAFTALADDINVMRYNIGALSNIQKTSLAINFHNWIDDTKQGSVALGLPLWYGTLGVELTYFDEGEITELDEYFRLTGGKGHSNDILFHAGYGSRIKVLDRIISVGAGFKLIRMDLIGQQSTSFAMDAGAYYQLKNFSFGAVFQNLGYKKIKFQNESASLPQSFKTGAAGRFAIGKTLNLNLASDIKWIAHEKLHYAVGGELDMNQLLFLRAGYQFQDTSPTPLSMGFGINMPMAWFANSQTRLDYAYSPIDDFETSMHRFSFNFIFGTIEDNRYDDINAKLQAQLEAANKARMALEDAEEKTKLMQKEMARRLANIMKIAAESEGKIEVEEKENKRILVSMRINFDFDKAAVRPDDYLTMKQVGEILNTYPEAKVHVSGHTDNIGTDLYNVRLSHRRVDSVMTYLSRKENVASNRFFMPIGFGESKPIAENATAEGRFRNRRVEFLLFTFDSKPEVPSGSALKIIYKDYQGHIVLECNGIVEYTDKILSDPDKLIIDLPGIVPLTEVKNYDFNFGAFIRARVGYHPDENFTRVVLDLSRAITPQITTLENLILIKE